jgi:twitching motility protein PilT
MNLSDLLHATVGLGASDLHLSVGSPPQVRVNGRLQQLDRPVLTPETVRAVVLSVLSEEQTQQLEDRRELDLAFGSPGLGRCRCNAFYQKGAIGAAFRLIPEKLRTFEELGLPAVLAELAERPRGLVLVTGPTGSGKSTTLAAMIDRINGSRPAHILTIEDPIEYLHDHKRALVNQRELHTDTRSFTAALRGALRADPDVVLIGEMRDLETMEAALSLAETGHLTLSTLHTNSAAQTMTRVIDAFPAHQQPQVRTQLSLVLEGIACQALLPRLDGSGRVAAFEILVATPAIRHLIRDDKIHQIYGAMQTGQGRVGMQTMNQALAGLVASQVISKTVAVATTSNREELVTLLDRGGPRVRTES